MDWTSSVSSGTPKPPWESLPATLRARLEARFGAVESVDTRPGGFTPSVAALVRLASGREVFVKAADARTHPVAASMHRTEADILATIGDEVRQVPRLLGALEGGGWVMLVLEAVHGRHPELPWRTRELDRTLQELARLGSELSPSPVAAPTVAERLGPEFDGWRQLREDRDALADLDLDWVASNIDRLAAIEEDWTAATHGDTLLHGDIRADQILLTHDGASFVDWAHACVGAAWVDPLLLFPSVQLQGGPEIGELIERSEQTAAVPGEHLVAVGAAMSGYLLHRSTMPPPAGLPTVRRFQRAQGEVTARWLQGVLGP